MKSECWKLSKMRITAVLFSNRRNWSVAKKSSHAEFRKDWAEHHPKLTSDDQLSPFEPLQKFEKEQLKITKCFSDTQAAPKFVKQSSTNTTNKWSNVHKSSYSVDVKPKDKCCHNNSIAACRQFDTMSKIAMMPWWKVGCAIFSSATIRGQLVKWVIHVSCAIGNNTIL